jgi:hypothetical protein
LSTIKYLVLLSIFSLSLFFILGTWLETDEPLIGILLSYITIHLIFGHSIKRLPFLNFEDTKKKD